MVPTFKRIHPTYFLVRIDRQKQYDKRNKQGSILLAPSVTFMAHNQQCGEIVAIGHAERYSEYRESFSPDGRTHTGMRRVFMPTAQEVLPQAEVGDTLLFAHWIEGSVEAKEQEQVEYDLQYLAHEDETWRYYWVRNDFAYGVSKPNGTIYVTPDTVFAHAAEQEVDSRDAVRIGNLYLLKNYKESHESIQQRIDDMKALTMEYVDKAKAREIQLEMEQLTKEKNKMRLASFIPAVVNEKFKRDCGGSVDDSDVLFYLIQGGKALDLQVLEIEYGGKKYYILKPDYIVAVMKRPQMFVGEKRLAYLNDES